MKKAEIAISTIIVLILLLIVLAVLMFFFGKRAGDFDSGVNELNSNGRICAKEGGSCILANGACSSGEFFNSIDCISPKKCCKTKKKS